MPIKYCFIISTLNTSCCNSFFTLRYHAPGASNNPYNAVFNFYNSLVLASFGGLIKTSLSIDFPCKKAVLISIVLILQLQEDVSTNNNLRFSLPQVGKSFLTSSLLASSKSRVTSRALTCFFHFDIFSVSTHLTETELCLSSSTSSYTLLILQFSNSFNFASATSKVPPLHNKTSSLRFSQPGIASKFFVVSSSKCFTLNQFLFFPLTLHARLMTNPFLHTFVSRS